MNALAEGRLFFASRSESLRRRRCFFHRLAQGDFNVSVIDRKSIACRPAISVAQCQHRPVSLETNGAEDQRPEILHVGLDSWRTCRSPGGPIPIRRPEPAIRPSHSVTTQTRSIHEKTRLAGRRSYGEKSVHGTQIASKPRSPSTPLVVNRE